MRRRCQPRTRSCSVAAGCSRWQAAAVAAAAVVAVVVSVVVVVVFVVILLLPVAGLQHGGPQVRAVSVVCPRGDGRGRPARLIKFRERSAGELRRGVRDLLVATCGATAIARANRGAVSQGLTRSRWSEGRVQWWKREGRRSLHRRVGRGTPGRSICTRSRKGQLQVKGCRRRQAKEPSAAAGREFTARGRVERESRETKRDRERQRIERECVCK